MRDGVDAQGSIKDKNGDTVVDLVPGDDPETLALIRKARAQASLAREDVVDGTHRSLRFPCTILTGLRTDDDDDEDGSGSGSDED